MGECGLDARGTSFGLHKILDVSQDGLSCMELVGYLHRFLFPCVDMMFRYPKVHRFAILIPESLRVRLEATSPGEASPH
jgi:hypothetical protein